jgi:pimeloyl-ACP methyl ester carboxylesterase
MTRARRLALHNCFEMERNRIMKRLLATFSFVFSGILLVSLPSQSAQSDAAAGFAPTRFSVVDEGAVGKPDVLLIPGNSSSRAVWDAEAQLLKPNYRLHLVQVGGFAGAAAGPNGSGPLLGPIVEELHAYIVANRLRPAVIGHSLGGLLTLMLASRHPEDVSRIVIVDALPFSAVAMDPAATVDSIKPQAEALRQQMMALPPEQYAAIQPMLAARMVKNADAQKLVAASGAASDRAVAMEAIVEDLETDLRGDVAGMKTPTLMLYAYDATAKQPDPAKYEATVQEAYKTMPHATLVRIDGSGHYIMYDQPEKFDAAVEAFLKQGRN